MKPRLTLCVLLASACEISAGSDTFAPLCTARPVDERAVLAQVATLPVSTWSYRWAPERRHLGPMAQDFRAAFGLGESERTYDPRDSHGVTLAALKALSALAAAQQERIGLLAEENRQLEQALTARGR